MQQISTGDIDAGGGVSIHLGDVINQPEPTPPAMALPGQRGIFVGREEELAELTSHAESSSLAICGVGGMGGVGKTELALVLAERLEEKYPDDGLLVDMQGTNKPPMTAVAALQQLVRGILGPAAQTYGNVSQLKQQLHGAIGNQRRIIVLDNVRDSAHVAPLLPMPKSCLTIVTSRQTIAHDRLHLVLLNSLPMDQAQELLLALCSRINGHAEDIAEEVGCLPLALRLAGTALAEAITLTPASYLAALQAQGGTVKLAEPALGASVALLDEALHDKWCQLAVFPADFDAGGAAAVWDGEEDTARGSLGDLVKRSLVQYDTETGRYRLHDLARDYAAHLACCDNHGGLDLALLRHARHYLQVLSAANRRYLEGNEGVLEGLAAFDREWPNIEAGQRWTVERSVEGGEAAWLCVMYPAVGWHCLSLREHPRDQIVWLEAALAVAEVSGDKEHQCVHLDSLAGAYYALGEIDKVNEISSRSLALSLEIGNRQLEGAALCNLGGSHMKLGEMDKAIEFLSQALAVSRDKEDRMTEATALGNLGIAHRWLGKYDQAIEYLQAQLDVSGGMGVQVHGATLNALGMVYSDLGDMEKAIEHYSQSLAVSRGLGDRRLEGTVLGNLGSAYTLLGQAERAIEHHTLAAAVSRTVEDQLAEIQHLNNLGLAYADLGDIEKAIEHYNQALAISRELGDRRSMGAVLGNLGSVYYTRGEVEKAIECHTQALAISLKLQDRSAEGQDLGNLGNAYAALGEADIAIEYLTKALGISRQIGDRLGEAEDRYNLGHGLQQLGRLDEARDQWQTALRQFEEMGIEHQAAIVRQALAWLDAQT